MSGITVFASVLLSVCIAEMGDKTQLLVVGFAAKHSSRDIIIGVLGATVILNAVAVLMGAMISLIIPMIYISLAAGFFFLVFALLNISDGEHSGSAAAPKRKGTAALGIGAAFFLAELGDKTQLSAIAFSASRPDSLLPVFLGATLGMFIADGVGLLVGRTLGKKLPNRIMRLISFGIFSIFGFWTLWRCFDSFIPGRAIPPLGIIITAFIILTLLIRQKGRQRAQ